VECFLSYNQLLQKVDARSRVPELTKWILTGRVFDKDDVVQRGRFYCQSGKDTCTFNAAFTFDFAKQEYHFKANGLNLEHNHASTALTIDGVRVKTRGCELSAEERSSISDLSPFMSIGALGRILRNMWPNLSFDADLL